MFAAVPAVVVDVARLSPNFTRVRFSVPPEIWFDGPLLDQRIKIILPSDDGTQVFGDDWFAMWQALPDGSRGAMRTYSVRDFSPAGATSRLTIDFALHAEPAGPASNWAASASPGDQLTIVAPRRGEPRAGVEFQPGEAKQVVLVGDETAAPAVARILADLAPDARGEAFLEVPSAQDALPLACPPGVRVTWLPRDGATHGARLSAALLGWLGAGGGPAEPAEEVGDLVWETPTFSALGEELGRLEPPSGTYYWIAGECTVVAGLRRRLVRDLGVPRGQVAFMGYWRKGRPAAG